MGRQLASGVYASTICVGTEIQGGERSGGLPHKWRTKPTPQVAITMDGTRHHPWRDKDVWRVPKSRRQLKKWKRANPSRVQKKGVIFNVYGKDTGMVYNFIVPNVRSHAPSGGPLCHPFPPFIAVRALGEVLA